MLRLPVFIPFVYYYATFPLVCPGYFSKFISPLGFVVLGLGRLGLWSTPFGACAAAEFVQLLYGSTTSYRSRTVFQVILDFYYELLLR